MISGDILNWLIIELKNNFKISSLLIEAIVLELGLIFIQFLPTWINLNILFNLMVL